MGQYFQYPFYTSHNKSSSYFYNIKSVKCWIICYCCVFVLKPWLIWLTNNTVRFFPEYFVCHFYFLWPKIIGKIFTPKTICCSESLSNFYQFYFWFCVFQFLLFGKMFLAYRFNSFDFVTATIFFKVFSNFINHLIFCFFLHNFAT